MDLKMNVDEIRNNIDLKKDDWINIHDTNCYAYALGLDIKESDIKDYAYVPGTISNSPDFLPKCSEFSYVILLNNIFSDLDYLNIDYRIINPEDKISDDEWKIALFISIYNNVLYDYHFLREKENGIWYPKIGYIGNISILDSRKNIIRNPSKCYIKFRNYDSCFSLKLKK